MIREVIIFLIGVLMGAVTLQISLLVNKPRVKKAQIDLTPGDSWDNYRIAASMHPYDSNLEQRLRNQLSKLNLISGGK